ncbi:hypothetical protein ACSLBF_19085 (plasmid) [Pseudoalteromonas sp. T1lg65]|uniref:hypothetical protein n=1 Tax=Pseudoalteromonas sp. T1lg65 TaxID=2077101 RepID=UPI003F7AA4E7
MLLNTVVVTINQILPVTVMWVLLMQCSKTTLSVKSTVLAAMLGLIGCLFFWRSGSQISSSFDYRGYELLQIGLLLILYCLVLISTCYSSTRSSILALAIACSLYVTHLASFFISYHKEHGGQIMLIAMTLGIGICLGFSTLLYFCLDWFKAHRVYGLLVVLVALHAASKVSQAVDLASQIDVIAVGAVMLDLRHIIDEYSVFGRMLKVLIGYEATPSSYMLLGFITAFAVFTSLVYWRAAHES